MGDALVDELDSCFELIDGNCPKCNGSVICVQLEPYYYRVYMHEGRSEPDSGQYGPEVVQAVCAKCGYEIRRKEHGDG